MAIEQFSGQATAGFAGAFNSTQDILTLGAGQWGIFNVVADAPTSNIELAINTILAFAPPSTSGIQAGTVYLGPSQTLRVIRTSGAINVTGVIFG